MDHARRRGLDATQATVAELAAYDQWTVPNVSIGTGPCIASPSRTGRAQSSMCRRPPARSCATPRVASAGGTTSAACAHWIYPTVLRSRPSVWNATVWTLSLAALIAAISGALLGTLRIRMEGHRLVSPFRGWHAWHHALGLGCMTFVLTWTFSGWLSMDTGRLFSTGKLTDAEAAIAASAPAWDCSVGARAATDVRAGQRSRMVRLWRQALPARSNGPREPARCSSATSALARPRLAREFLQPGEIDALRSPARPRLRAGRHRRRRR